MGRKMDFENTLSLTKITLLMSGIKIYHSKWNSLIEHFVNYWLYYINLIVLYSVIIGEIHWIIDGVEISKRFVELSLMVPCVTISILGTLKSLPLYYNRDSVVNMIDKLRRIHPELPKYDTHDINRYNTANTGSESNIINKDSLSEEANDVAEKAIVKDSVKKLNNIISMLKMINVAVITMFCSTPLMSMGYDYYKNGHTVVKYPFVVNYYFDVYATSMWPLEYLHQVWATGIVCVNLFASESLFYVLCSYIEMHFRIMCCRLEQTVSRSWKETKENLANAVKQHLVLIDFVEQTEMLYSKVMLGHIVSSSFLICLSAFNITVTDDIGKVSAFTTFLLMSLFQIYLLCFFGDKLMRSSTDVSAAIYKSAWYDADLDTKKIILYIIIRAQKPCKLTAANFVDLNLTAFTTILCLIVFSMQTKINDTPYLLSLPVRHCLQISHYTAFLLLMFGQ